MAGFGLLDLFLESHPLSEERRASICRTIGRMRESRLRAQKQSVRPEKPDVHCGAKCEEEGEKAGVIL
jgi:hypothetical protein